MFFYVVLMPLLSRELQVLFTDVTHINEPKPLPTLTTYQLCLKLEDKEEKIMKLRLQKEHSLSGLMRQAI